MGFGKYGTLEQKELKHQIETISNSMNSCRRRYLNLDVKRNVIIKKIEASGVTYGNGKKKRGKQ